MNTLVPDELAQLDAALKDGQTDALPSERVDHDWRNAEQAS